MEIKRHVVVVSDFCIYTYIGSLYIFDDIYALYGRCVM